MTSLLPLVGVAVLEDIRSMADALTLVALILLISTPGWLLVAFAIRRRCQRPNWMTCHEFRAHHHFRGQPSC
jgi:hypothetical protein